MAEGKRVIVVTVVLDPDIAANADELAELMVEDMKANIEMSIDDAREENSGEDHEWDSISSTDMKCIKCGRLPEDHYRSVVDRFGHFVFWIANVSVIKP
jgi:hypothetical protein